MSLDNNSANNFKDFLDAIKPFLNYQLYDMSGMGVEAFQFSTDEKPVGMWTDRKIVYQKVFTNRTMPSANGLIANTVVSDLEKAIKTTIIATGGNQIIINPSLGQNIITYYKGTSGIWVDYTNNPSWVYGSTVEIIIQYTKTTDSPLASDEKFAGVTSGGEVIYEQTLTVNNVTVPEKTWTNLSSVPSNSDLLIDSIIYTNANLIAYPFVRFNNGYLQAFNATQIANINKATIRYTKSS